MKKLFAILMALVFTVCGSAFVLTACGSDGDTNNDPSIEKPEKSDDDQNNSDDDNGEEPDNGIWTPPVKQ